MASLVSRITETTGLRSKPASAIMGFLLLQVIIGYEWLISGVVKVVRGTFPTGLAEELTKKVPEMGEFADTYEVQRMTVRDSTNTTSEDAADAHRGPIGVGSEAAEGIHDVDMVGGHLRTGLGHRATGRSVGAGDERSGSEPLRERSWVHESGYGGKGGAPRTSSEQREADEQHYVAPLLAHAPPSDTHPDRVTALTGYAGSIEKQTLENTNFRQVLFTGRHSQLVVMCLQPGEEIGSETHAHVDQFFRLEQGEATFTLNGSDQYIVGAGDAVVVPAGTNHNVRNTSRSVSLRLYTIYSPPNHPNGTVHKTKADAEAAEVRL